MLSICALKVIIKICGVTKGISFNIGERIYKSMSVITATVQAIF